MVQLVRYEQARNALAEAHRVDEVKDIRDKAEAMAAYARQAKDQELILWATEIKVRAERKAGELLAMARANGDRAGSGGSLKKESKPATLSDIGISNDQSSRWQQLASMSADHFEAAVATAKDTAGQVTTAFMLREAGKSRPSKKLSEADKGRLEKLNEVKGASVLVGYVRMVMKSMRDKESLTEQERQALGALKAEIDRALALH
jgi:hypothetical protein